MKDMTKAYLIRTIHQYGRARAGADFMLGSHDLSNAEIDQRIKRVMCNSERIDQFIADELEGLPTNLALVSGISEFATQLHLYGSNRHDGHGPEAAVDVIEALDALLDAAALTRMNQARERAA